MFKSSKNPISFQKAIKKMKKMNNSIDIEKLSINFCFPYTYGDYLSAEQAKSNRKNLNKIILQLSFSLSLFFSSSKPAVAKFPSANGFTPHHRIVQPPRSRPGGRSTPRTSTFPSSGRYVTAKPQKTAPGGGGFFGGNGGDDNGRTPDFSCLPKKEQPTVPDPAWIPDETKKPLEQCKLEDYEYEGFAHKLDENGNPILKVTGKNGSELLVPYDKALEKYYHYDVYDLKKPEKFDAKKARFLKPKDRLEYLKETVPRDKVIEFQISNAKSLSSSSVTS